MTTFNIGKEAAVAITVNGVPLNPLTITKFSYKEESSEPVSNPLNGPPNKRKVPMGNTGDLTYDRGGSALDAYFANEAAGYYANLPPPVIVIALTVLDPVTFLPFVLRFPNAIIKLDDGGSYSSEAKVEQKVSWWSQPVSQVQ